MDGFRTIHNDSVFQRRIIVGRSVDQQEEIRRAACDPPGFPELTNIMLTQSLHRKAEGVRLPPSDTMKFPIGKRAPTARKPATDFYATANRTIRNPPPSVMSAAQGLLPHLAALLLTTSVSICCLPTCTAAEPSPLSPQTSPASMQADWLLNSSPFKAGVFRGGGPEEVVLQNGLLRRTFKLAPNAATVGLDNLMTGQPMLRAVEPKATVTIDGQEFKVGGLRGQPDRAYLLPEWTAKLTNDPGAFQFVGFTEGKPAAPFVWKRKRHSADLLANGSDWHTRSLWRDPQIIRTRHDRHHG